jgi:hypothetical protein
MKEGGGGGEDETLFHVFSHPTPLPFSSLTSHPPPKLEVAVTSSSSTTPATAGQLQPPPLPKHHHLLGLDFSVSFFICYLQFLPSNPSFQPFIYPSFLSAPPPRLSTAISFFLFFFASRKFSFCVIGCGMTGARSYPRVAETMY